METEETNKEEPVEPNTEEQAVPKPKTPWVMPDWMADNFGDWFWGYDKEDVEEHYNSDGKKWNVHNNAPMALQAVATKTQVDTLIKLHSEGKLILN